MDTILNPIEIVQEVIDEYRNHLQTEFRPRDVRIREEFETVLASPEFLAREAFFQSHRPFQARVRWSELPINPKLATVMDRRTKGQPAYSHQSEAITHLLGPNPSSIVVSTGTGSGKSECFLIPVIHNAIQDALQFKQNGLTAILVYPMNALANDQMDRINTYLDESGYQGVVRVRQYDQRTTQAGRREMRGNPPHILLTNYMMLEYLLIRPADRDGLFANHRCRFLALDEVHVYRGALGSNLALLVRRAREHLRRARQDWLVHPPESVQSMRYPTLIPLGTSATIKSMSDETIPVDQQKQERDQAVQEFFAKLTGEPAATIKVLGEEIVETVVPTEARYAGHPIAEDVLNLNSEAGLRSALCRLAGIEETRTLTEAAERCRLIWDLNRWLAKKPEAISGLVEKVKNQVFDRASVSDAEISRELQTALLVGASLGEIPGSLRLRMHQFFRGGWEFYRCLSPTCLKLFPHYRDQCECGHKTAQLFLCRSCGADYVRLIGDPLRAPLRVAGDDNEEAEWLLYEASRIETDLNQTSDDDDDVLEDEVVRTSQSRSPRKVGGRPVLWGSFDPVTQGFSLNPNDFSVKGALLPNRSRCLCCGGRAGTRSMLTPVSLGTSAAVKVISESLMESLSRFHARQPDGVHKERLLVFSDSRQDAAHQARFIAFSVRYDRMRRRVVHLLQSESELSFQETVERLGTLADQHRDNPYLLQKNTRITKDALEKIRLWEEAPLLDDLATNAGFRATLVNLGLVHVVYEGLTDFAATDGATLAAEFQLSTNQLEHLCRCLLDVVRTRGCLSRELLRFHQRSSSFRDILKAAKMERRVSHPQGLPIDEEEMPILRRNLSEVAMGTSVLNVWRALGKGGQSPRLEKIIRNLFRQFQRPEPDGETALKLLFFLRRGNYLTPNKLHGYRETEMMLQLNSEVVYLRLTPEHERLRCGVCLMPLSGSKVGMPCPGCHGKAVSWPNHEVQANRYARRIASPEEVLLEAREHTAQIPNSLRKEIEDQFKAESTEAPVNLLACSPTLEMGVDVGGLDAVVLRNIPPRPDNYAQRGGRAGRRTRVGIVLGYARKTPHDQYFYQKPAEMIAGEVPAPAIGLGNRDVILRHLAAIAFGATEPGVAGQMVEYIRTTGEIQQEKVDELNRGIIASSGYALEVALSAWGVPILNEAGLTEADLVTHLEALPERIQDVMNRTARQIRELRQSIEYFAEELKGNFAANRAGLLIRRILGIKEEDTHNQNLPDDRSGGYPLRRFAEFGLLPGYEFPSEPSTLRLLSDVNEDEPLSVKRQLGINQFRPGAHVYARTRRWEVIGLDTASPWNPPSESAVWNYEWCRGCDLRFESARHPKCPRCGNAESRSGFRAAEFAGFVARVSERPILDEEDRFAVRNLVQVYPQWDGNLIARWDLGGFGTLQLTRNEHVRWLNEGLPPTETELKELPVLSEKGKGYFLCSSCGRELSIPETERKPEKQRSQVNRGQKAQDEYGHASGCVRAGERPLPIGLVTHGQAEILRLLVHAPPDENAKTALPWAYSFGYAILAGIQHRYMLDSSEIEIAVEGPWKTRVQGQETGVISVAFIDTSLGGSGYLSKIAAEFHLVAQRAIDHLDHQECEKACYRCLKSYQNQRYHTLLSWPLVLTDLEMLSETIPTSNPITSKELNDPQPWLEAYAEGVGSPLELKFYRLFEQFGFYPLKQHPISVTPGGPTITVADFAVLEKRLAIYIDGSAFHIGASLRRDYRIRLRLEQCDPPWRVVALRAADLAAGADLVQKLCQ